MESIGKRILELLSDQNVSQKTLADELQVSRSTLNNYLKGRRWLSPDLICGIYPVNQHLAATRNKYSVEVLCKSGFAASVMTEYRNKAALFYRQIYIAQHS